MVKNHKRRRKIELLMRKLLSSIPFKSSTRFKIWRRCKFDTLRAVFNRSSSPAMKAKTKPHSQHTRDQNPLMRWDCCNLGSEVDHDITSVFELTEFLKSLKSSFIKTLMFQGLEDNNVFWWQHVVFNDFDLWLKYVHKETWRVEEFL